MVNTSTQRSPWVKSRPWHLYITVIQRKLYKGQDFLVTMNGGGIMIQTAAIVLDTVDLKEVQTILKKLQKVTVFGCSVNEY